MRALVYTLDAQSCKHCLIACNLRTGYADAERVASR